MTNHPDPQGLADRYAAVWVEADPARRRAAIEALWAPDGSHILHPPQDVRASAAQLGFAASELRATGHAAIEVRVERSYEEFVAPGEYTFRARPDAVGLADAVKFVWEMVPVAGGEVAGGGVEFVILDEDGLIKADYMFPGL